VPIEDKARLDVPIAICWRPVASSEASDASPPGASAGERDCTGQTYDAAPGAPVRPVPLAADGWVLAPDKTQIVWLPAFRTAATVARGPMALVRARATEIDVFALGAYAGSARHSRFDLARLGRATAIAALDDGCADATAEAECESDVTLFVERGGALVEQARSPARGLRFGVLRGVGRVQYRLTTEPPAFDARTIRFHERLEVRDSRDEDVRVAEGDRVLSLADDGTLVALQDSLWDPVAKGL
jgi:hypothetical protein